MKKYTDTIILEGNINKVECNKNIIGVIKDTEVNHCKQIKITITITPI